MTDFRLSEIQRIQAVFDGENDNFLDADVPDVKRSHTGWHLGKLVGKVATVEERAGHGEVDETVIAREVIGDLLVYAAQYANVLGVNLSEAYEERLRVVAERNGTGIESAERAFGVIE